MQPIIKAKDRKENDVKQKRELSLAEQRLGPRKTGRKCETCGKRTHLRGAVYCENCGAKLPAPTPPAYIASAL
jgi:uncharacterized OB-fold protein